MRRVRGSLDAGDRRAVGGMAAFVAALHIVGFVLLLVVLAPIRRHTGSAAALTVGIGITAYMLGVRHAFDADHIAAIDNATRRLMAVGRRPLSAGFWFSLGHSTVVFALTLLISLGVRTIDGAVRDRASSLHAVAGSLGTMISGAFLYLIAALNVAILLGIVRVVREMRHGRGDERELERRLDSRGLMNRLFGRLGRTVGRPVQMYPVGLLFGLGFDTASEVALLVIAGSAGAAGLPWYALLCLPVLFAAGMSLLDSLDGALMNAAYGWAVSRPALRVFYNLTMTGLSVAIALVIGTVELGGLLARHLNLAGGFWAWFEHIDLNLLGFAIIGLFMLTWAIAGSVWRFGHIEEHWGARGDE